MTRGSRIVDVYATVQDVEQFYIAIDGVVNSVAEAYIAETGVIHQFWPPTVQQGDAIVMTTDTEESYATAKLGEGLAEALCSWDCRTGRLILSDKNTYRNISVLAPAPRAAGQYVMRIELVSGDVVLEFPTGEWHDVYEYGNLGIFSNYLTNGFSVQSVIYGEVTVSIAEDDGAGQPIGPTIVSKTVNLKAEIIGDNLSFTTAPWTLSSVRWNEFAGVVLLTVPAGFGFENEAFVTGNTFQDNPPFEDTYVEIIREIYAVEWGPNFLVKVDVISGAVTGSTTGAYISTLLTNRWYVDAPNPLDNNSATVDITITDGINEVTKRVFMNAVQNADNNDAGSEPSDDFTRYDLLADRYGLLGTGPLIVSVTLEVNIDGTVNSYGYRSGQDVDFPQNWNDLAPSVPDPQNFECRLTILDGDQVYTGSSPTGVWVNLSTMKQWSYYLELAERPDSGIVEQVNGEWQLEIREVGRPTTVKTKMMNALVSIIGPPGGGI